MAAEPRLPRSSSAPIDAAGSPKRKGRQAMASLACPRCHIVGRTWRIPDKLDMGVFKLDLPFFECAGCGNRWYDYTEMLAYIMARNEADKLGQQQPPQQ